MKSTDVLCVLQVLDNGEMCAFYMIYKREEKCAQVAVMKSADVLCVLQVLDNGEMCTFYMIYKREEKCAHLAVMKSADVLCVLQALNNGKMGAFFFPHVLFITFIIYCMPQSKSLFSISAFMPFSFISSTACFIVLVYILLSLTPDIFTV